MLATPLRRCGATPAISSGRATRAARGLPPGFDAISSPPIASAELSRRVEPHARGRWFDPSRTDPESPRKGLRGTSPPASSQATG